MTVGRPLTAAKAGNPLRKAIALLSPSFPLVFLSSLSPLKYLEYSQTSGCGCCQGRGQCSNINSHYESASIYRLDPPSYTYICRSDTAKHLSAAVVQSVLTSSLISYHRHDINRICPQRGPLPSQCTRQ